MLIVIIGWHVAINKFGFVSGFKKTENKKEVSFHHDFQQQTVVFFFLLFLIFNTFFIVTRNVFKMCDCFLNDYRNFCTFTVESKSFNHFLGWIELFKEKFLVILLCLLMSLLNLVVIFEKRCVLENIFSVLMWLIVDWHLGMFVFQFSFGFSFCFFNLFIMTLFIFENCFSFSWKKEEIKGKEKKKKNLFLLAINQMMI